MKTLITYSSRSGNTEKLARAIYDHWEGEKEICPVDDAPPAGQYHRVALGFWLMAGKPDPRATAYLSTCGPDTRLFLFATHGAARDSAHARTAMAHAVDLTCGAQIEGVFNCQGEVNPKVLEKVRQKDPPPVWINDAEAAMGHPNVGDIEELKAVLDTL